MSKQMYNYHSDDGIYLEVRVASKCTISLDENVDDMSCQRHGDITLPAQEMLRLIESLNKSLPEIKEMVMAEMLSK